MEPVSDRYADTLDLVSDVYASARVASDLVPPMHPRAAYDFIRKRTRYLADRVDMVTLMPWVLARKMVGDCKSSAVFIASTAKAAGHTVRLRFVRYAGQDHFGHVYAVVDDDPVDPLLAYGDQVSFVESIDIEF